MTDPPTGPEHRTSYRARPDETRLVDPSERDDDGIMAIRLPVASTGEVRNKGDDPLTREELEGMARQINSRNIGVFPDHGLNHDTAGDRYSQLEKMGWWSDADVEGAAAADDADLLYATANMPDPDTLPEETGGYREALAVYKAQAERGVPMDASIGWREDDDAPGGNDLMEVSIVGIGADPRTNVGPQGPAGAQAQAVARAAVAAGADPDDLVAAVRDAVDGDTADATETETDERMSESDTGDDAGTTDAQDADGDTDGERSTDELLRELLDLQRQQLAEMREGDDKDDEEEEEEDDEDDDRATDADADDTQEADADGDADTQGVDDDAADLREEIRDLREDYESLKEDIRNGDADLDERDEPEGDDGGDTDADRDAEADDAAADAEDDDTEERDNDGSGTVSAGFDAYNA